MDNVKSTEEIRAELEKAEKDSTKDPSMTLAPEWVKRICDIEDEIELNTEAITGLSTVESKNNTSNLLLFGILTVGFCLCAYIGNKNTADIDLMRRRILEQGNLLNDLSELAGKVGE
ncbi:MAG TPA: hypothetical protein VGF75_02930 [Candidatus Saccharimonadales bacterium]|jgi:hypothetical protein